MAMDFIGLSVGMGYTDETVIGGGALKGKNCVVSNIEEVADGVNVTFRSILDDGTVKTDTVFIPKGTQGEAGVAGKSAYEIWLEAGNTGTEEDFLISLVGEKGDDGKSAYQYAQDGGYIGTETEFTTNIARSGVISKELEVERARIDNLTTLQDGSTTGDAELIDARIDKDGNTHVNVGEHIRSATSQLSSENAELKSDLVNYDKGIKTLENYSVWKVGTIINGVYYPDCSYRVATSNYIIFDKYTELTISEGRRFCLHFVNEDNNLISKTGWISDSYSVPPNKRFYIEISSTTSTTEEEKTVNANVSEFLQWLTIRTSIGECVEKTKYISKVLTNELDLGWKLYLRSYSWTIVDRAKTKLVWLPKGTLIIPNENIRIIVYGFEEKQQNVNDNWDYDSNYVMEPKNYIFKNDSWSNDIYVLPQDALVGILGRFPNDEIINDVNILKEYISIVVNNNVIIDNYYKALNYGKNIDFGWKLYLRSYSWTIVDRAKSKIIYLRKGSIIRKKNNNFRFIMYISKNYNGLDWDYDSDYFPTISGAFQSDFMFDDWSFTHYICEYDMYVSFLVSKPNDDVIDVEDFEDISDSIEIISSNNNIKNNFVSSDFRYDSDIDNKIVSYADVISETNDFDTFMFFTDPHTFRDDYTKEDEIELSIGKIEYVFNNTPTDFVLCGGDWLQSGETQTEAIRKLGRIDGIMRCKFGDSYYPLLGNHDTNYQGVDNDGNSNNGSHDTYGMLSQDVLKNLWFRKYGNTYYDFCSSNGTRFYCFDSGLDWDQSMTSHRWDQVYWFANKLLNNDDTHSVIAIHILTLQSRENIDSDGIIPQDFINNLTMVANAYNERNSIICNAETFDFSNVIGKVAFVISGHSHYDADFTVNNIPCIITTNSGYESNFDLCCIDYTNAKLKTIRVGTGSNRSIDIIV